VTPSVEVYAAEARRWLEANARRKAEARAETVWGEGSDSTAVFHNLSDAEEAELLDALREWQRRKYDAGYGAIAWPTELGGAGLSRAYERAFAREEAAFETPRSHEVLGVTVGLVAPTVRAYGTHEQQARFCPMLLRSDALACQLFSEPGAGSDLASLATRAVRDGDEWVITGQKVWTSGARHCAWGELIARTDLDVPKHKGMTAFLVPLDLPGVEIRPIRQMSGGSSFNEVFLSEVRVPDTLRLGDVGEGWKVALTTLGFERAASGGGGGGGRVGGSWTQLLGLAEHLARTDDPRVRQDLARSFIGYRLLVLNAQRAQALARSGTPGAEGSIGKLFWTEHMREVSGVASRLLGPRLAADTGEWGTFAWTEHLLGAPGYRIAGGSDEVQRNIIGERVLGLPGEPRVDRDVTFREQLRS